MLTTRARMPSGQQARASTAAHLGTGADQDDVRRAVARRPARSRRGARPGARRAARSKIGSAWRVNTSVVGPWRRSIATRQPSVTSLASAGRNTTMFGIARSAGSCSTG